MRVVLLLAVFSTQVFGCEIRFSAGPFIDPDLVYRIYSPFISAIEESSDCSVSLEISPDYIHYLNTLNSGEIDFFIGSEEMVLAFERRGYKSKYVTPPMLSGYIVRNKNENKRISEGSIIVTNPLSRGALLVEEFEIDNNSNFDKKIIIENFTDGILAFLNGASDYGFMFNYVYEKLPMAVKASIEIVYESEKTRAVLMLSESIDPKKDALINEYISLTNGLYWEDVEAHIVDKFSNEFSRRLVDWEVGL